MDAVDEEESDHWSFQPIVRPDVPDIMIANVGDQVPAEYGTDGLHDSRSHGNPIDAFLLDQLAKQN